LESPTNPTMDVLHRPPSKPLVLVDYSFLSPFYSSPLLGAYIILDSLTKYINGHSDVLMGALILPLHLASLADNLRLLQKATGDFPSPHHCWLTHPGSKSFHLRMKTNALAVTQVLEH
ncbi:hypothetical protein C0991_001495, partial [Blastosporella zonata]